jgi:hypothetical protein
VSAGERWRFFDYRPWERAGGDHPEGNDRYFLPATVVRVYSRPGYDELADIEYDHEPGRISRAHFTNIVMPVAR